jgi:hypothetical protein
MARKTDNYRYAIIPAGAITDARVEPRALQVLCLLGRHANDNGWCRRSQVKMAEELNCGRTTINRAIDLLVETGYVERKEEGRGSAKPQPGKQPFAAYSYRVRLDRSDKEIQDVTEGGVYERTPDGGCQPVDRGVSTQADTGVSTSRTPLTEHTPSKDAPVEQEEGRASPAPEAVQADLLGDDPSKPLSPAETLNAAYAAYEEARQRTGWSKVQMRTGARDAALRARLKEAGGLQGWHAAIARAEASDFCCGRAPPGHGRTKAFMADFDKLTQQSFFVKLMEGKYDNREGGKGPSGGGGGILEVAARRAADRAAAGS